MLKCVEKRLSNNLAAIDTHTKARKLFVIRSIKITAKWKKQMPQKHKQNQSKYLDVQVEQQTEMVLILIFKQVFHQS